MRPEVMIVAASSGRKHAKETCCRFRIHRASLLMKSLLGERRNCSMEVVYPRCAGLDVHKKMVVVCVLITRPNGSIQKEIRTFLTMTADLLALDEWLRSFQAEQIAIESTGVYWHPVYNLLEEGRTIILVNPQHLKAVPGRKTDVKDAQWLADLLRHGLLKASFIPPQPIRELRELTRYRKTLVQERARSGSILSKRCWKGPISNWLRWQPMC
jgi:transposase